MSYCVLEVQKNEFLTLQRSGGSLKISVQPDCHDIFIKKVKDRFSDYISD